MRLFSFILDVLFPQKARVAELEGMDASELSARAGRVLERAGKDILSVFDYRDPLVRQAVWELKYRGNKKVARLLAEVLYDELLAFLEEYSPLTNFEDPLLIPIPLSKERERERGFNQCRLLVDEMMRLDISLTKGSTAVFGRRVVSRTKGGPPERLFSRAGTAVSRLRRSGFGGQVGGEGCVGRNFTLCPHGLSKPKHTGSQTKTQNRREREQNLSGCFAADATVVRGRNIILIDDVATTGATIEEARRTLKAAGARRVIAFTVAH